MKLLSLSTLLILFTSSCLAATIEPSPQKLRTLYNRLDPTSLSQHLAFYKLYSSSKEGEQALRDAYQLLAGKPATDTLSLRTLPLSPSLIEAIIALMNKQNDHSLPSLSEEELQTLESFSSRLSHHRLKGHHVWNEQEIIHLPAQDIDLARGLFVSQLGEDRQRIRTYEAIIDLMALQVLARLSPTATPQAKIQAINTLIFEEMGFRFPPHSLYAKDIDVYTCLPSVLDSHRGVCLGVSILYLCLAQRLALPLEMITPPGHIYIRHREGDNLINIETTARGIHLDSEHYLSVNTCALQERTIKEVIGLVHFNQASVFWQDSQYERAFLSYERARAYLPDDPLLKELMAYACLLTHRQELGHRLLKEIQDYISPYAITNMTITEDYLKDRMDAPSIALLFLRTEDDRASLLEKKTQLENAVKQFPFFRAGLLQLGATWLQLHRLSEALDVLKRYYTLHPHDPEVNYYLALLYSQRVDYQQAWHHLRQAEQLTQAKGYTCKLLKEMRKKLTTQCPE